MHDSSEEHLIALVQFDVNSLVTGTINCVCPATLGPNCHLLNQYLCVAEVQEAIILPYLTVRE